MNTASRIGLFAIFLGACAAPQNYNHERAHARALAPLLNLASGPLFPAPSGPLSLQGDGGRPLNMFEVLERLSSLTNVTYSSDARITEQLKATPVALTQSGKVSGEDAYAWVESLLSQSGFTLAMLQQGKRPLVGVYSTASRPASAPPFLVVDVAQIDECRAHPALLVSMVVSLPHTDVRALGNSLRTLTQDNGPSMVTPVGTTKSVVIGGTGRYVADTVTMLLTVDQRAGEGKALDPNSPPPAGP